MILNFQYDQKVESLPDLLWYGSIDGFKDRFKWWILLNYKLLYKTSVGVGLLGLVSIYNAVVDTKIWLISAAVLAVMSVSLFVAAHSSKAVMQDFRFSRMKTLHMLGHVIGHEVFKPIRSELIDIHTNYYQFRCIVNYHINELQKLCDYQPGTQDLQVDHWWHEWNYQVNIRDGTLAAYYAMIGENPEVLATALHHHSWLQQYVDTGVEHELRFVFETPDMAGIIDNAKSIISSTVFKPVTIAPPDFAADAITKIHYHMMNIVENDSRVL